MSRRSSVAALWQLFNSASLDCRPAVEESISMTTLQFPGAAPKDELAPANLVEILDESAYLLEASRNSDDVEVREASIDLAIRALRAAGIALGRDVPPARPKTPGKIIRGPWAKLAAES